MHTVKRCICKEYQSFNCVFINQWLDRSQLYHVWWNTIPHVTFHMEHAEKWSHPVSRGHNLVCTGELLLAVYTSNNAPTLPRVWPRQTRCHLLSSSQMQRCYRLHVLQVITSLHDWLGSGHAVGVTVHDTNSIYKSSGLPVSYLHWRLLPISDI